MALKSLLSVRKAFFFLFLIAALSGKAQLPTFNCYITNEVQISSTVYQFDLYLLSTGTASFQYAQAQYGFSVNSAVANGGILSGSIVAGSTTLTNSTQKPLNVQTPLPFNATTGSYYFNISAHSCSCPGSGSVISNVNSGCSSPGTRIATFQITNTKGFTTGSHMNHVFNFTGSSTQTAVQIFAYVGGLNTDVTANGTYYSYNTAGTCLQNIALASCLFNASASGTGVSCFGGNNGTATATTSGSSGVGFPTYLWSTGAITSTITGLSAGIYSVTATDNVGCTATASVSISQPASALSATCNATNVSCSGSGNDGTSTALPTGGSPPYTYLWSNGATGISATGLTIGNYTVTVTDSHGCSTTCTSTVNTCNHLTMSLQNCSQIDQGTIQFDLMIASDGASTSDLRMTAVAYGINYDTLILKSGGTLSSLVLAGTTDPFLYPGFNFSPVPSVINNHLRFSSLTYTGPNYSGTVNTVGTTVTFMSGTNFPFPSTPANFWNNHPILINGVSYTVASITSATTLTLTTSAGIQTGVNYGLNSMQVGHQYRVATVQVSSSSTLIGNKSPNFTLQDVVAQNKTNCLGQPFIGNAAGVTNFSITGTGNGQRSVATACSLILNPCDLTATTSVTPPSCFGSTNGTATAFANSANQYTPFAYVWSNGQTNPDGPSGTATNLTAGTYTVTITDDALCSATATAIVTQPAPIIASPGSNTPVCSGSALNLSSNPAGGTSPYHYAWTGPNTFSSTAANPSIASATTAASGTYSVTVTDNKGCSTVATTTVTVTSCGGSTLNLKFYVQGYYITGGTMKPVLLNESVAGATSSQVDTFTIELHNSSSPFALAESFKGIVNTSGNLACSFSGATIGNSYYIVIKHRNAIQTWSANPVTITSVANYDFTTAFNEAFGNNMIQMEAGKFALYNGDVDQSGTCNGQDFNIMEGDVRAIATGYRSTDVDGNGIVNGSDFNLLEGNVRAIITTQHP